MNTRILSLVTAAAFTAALAFAAAGPPLAGVWNIAPTGRAGTSGSLHFRITQIDGSDPVDVTVPVIAGARDLTIARNIRNSLGSQLRRDRFKVELGEGTNVLVSDPRGQPNFSIELLDSDIDELRVAVQSVTPAAPPTVPPQETPAVPPANPPATPPPQPGPATTVPGAGMGIPDNSTPRLPNTSPPANPSPSKPPPNTPPPTR